MRGGGHQGRPQLPFASKKRDSIDLHKDLPEVALGHATLNRSMQTGNAALNRNSHGAQREAATAVVAHETAVSLQLARQSLRKIGFSEIKRQCKLQFPKYNRKEINQLAKQLHDEAWRNRDKQAVDRFLHAS